MGGGFLASAPAFFERGVGDDVGVSPQYEQRHGARRKQIGQVGLAVHGVDVHPRVFEVRPCLGEVRLIGALRVLEHQRLLIVNEHRVLLLRAHLPGGAALIAELDVARDPQTPRSQQNELLESRGVFLAVRHAHRRSERKSHAQALFDSKPVEQPPDAPRDGGCRVRFRRRVALAESGQVDRQSAVVRGEEGLIFRPVVRRPEAAMNEEEGFFAAVPRLSIGERAVGGLQCFGYETSQ